MARQARPKYSMGEVRTFINLYVAMAKRPITISATQLHKATGLSLTHCNELIEELAIDESLTTSRQPRGLSVVPDRYIRQVLKQEAKPKAVYDPERTYPHQVDEILQFFKDRHPNYSLSNGERHALVNLTKTYGFSRIKDLVAYAMSNEFWSPKVKNAFDLYKQSGRTGRSYIDTIADSYDRDLQISNSDMTALV